MVEIVNNELRLGNCRFIERRETTELIVHCSATPEGKNFTVQDIQRWHKARKWQCIGYHYVIYLDGTIHAGRPEWAIGAHANNGVDHNSKSVGVCYIGGVAKDGKTPKDTRTEAQKASLQKLLKQLKAQYPNAKIYGHRDFAKKACPSFDARTEYANI